MEKTSKNRAVAHLSSERNGATRTRSTLFAKRNARARRTRSNLTLRVSPIGDNRKRKAENLREEVQFVE